MNDAAKAIKDACDAIVADPKYRPLRDKDGKVVKTFCNLALQEVAKVAGFEGFKGLLANDIHKLCLKSGEWSQVGASQAAAAASQGMLTIAAQQGKPRGHVAVVYPGAGLVYSGKWKADCPIVANVGMDNKLCGSNFAFSGAEPPDYFTWTKKEEEDEE